MFGLRPRTFNSQLENVLSQKGYIIIYLKKKYALKLAHKVTSDESLASLHEPGALDSDREGCQAHKLCGVQELQDHLQEVLWSNVMNL